MFPLARDSFSEFCHQCGQQRSPDALSSETHVCSGCPQCAHHPARRDHARLLGVQFYSQLLFPCVTLRDRHQSYEWRLLLSYFAIPDWSIGGSDSERSSGSYIHANAAGVARRKKVQAAHATEEISQNRQRPAACRAIAHDYQRGAQFVAQHAGILYHRPAGTQGGDHVHMWQSGASRFAIDRLLISMRAYTFSNKFVTLL